MIDRARAALWRYRVRRREERSLAGVTRLACDVSALRNLDAASLAAMFSHRDLSAEWDVEAPSLEQACRIEDGTTGGVNPGDRRAVWHLVRALPATKVLEIGTHVGASTLYIAAALRKTTSGGTSSSSLITVDVEDVNATGGPWQRHGLRASPREMLHDAGLDGMVRFVTASSLDFLARSDDRFDLIFLDGDHAASTVYQELSAALRLLRPGGVILLHDYYPDRRPLWRDGRIISGPWLAGRRFRAEGAEIEILPLGDLPWATKQGTHTTSLAIVGRSTRL